MKNIYDRLIELTITNEDTNIKECLNIIDELNIIKIDFELIMNDIKNNIKTLKNRIKEFELYELISEINEDDFSSPFVKFSSI